MGTSELIRCLMCRLVLSPYILPMRDNRGPVYLMCTITEPKFMGQSYGLRTTRPKDNSPQDNSPKRKLAPRQLAPQSEDNSPHSEDNSPHIQKTTRPTTLTGQLALTSELTEGSRDGNKTFRPQDVSPLVVSP